MSKDTSLVTLSKTEFELIKSKLIDLPQEPLARILAIAQAVDDSGIKQERLNDVFYEVCKRL
jgi:hypothetical protein